MRPVGSKYLLEEPLGRGATGTVWRSQVRDTGESFAMKEPLKKLTTVGGLTPADSLTSREIAEGKSQLKGQVTLSLESPSSRMYRAAGVALYDEPFRSLDDVLKLIDDITPESVAEVSAAYFDPDRQTVLALGGGDW